jgi:hypothetical protein
MGDRARAEAEGRKDDETPLEEWERRLAGHEVGAGDAGPRPPGRSREGRRANEEEARRRRSGRQSDDVVFPVGGGAESRAGRSGEAESDRDAADGRPGGGRGCGSE